MKRMFEKRQCFIFLVFFVFCLELLGFQYSARSFGRKARILKLKKHKQEVIPYDKLLTKSHDNQ